MKTSAESIHSIPCEYCGGPHETLTCYRIESIEYFPNGRVKKVVLRRNGPLNVVSGPVERFT